MPAQFHASVPGLLPSARSYIVLCFSGCVDSHFRARFVVADAVLALSALLAVGSDTNELPQPFSEPLAQSGFCIFSMHRGNRKAIEGTNCIRPLPL